jgi:hypothetical protein
VPTGLGTKKGQFKDMTKTHWSPGASDLGKYNFCALGIIQKIILMSEITKYIIFH